MKTFLSKILIYIVITSFLSCIILFLLSFMYWDNRIPIIKKGILNDAGNNISIVLGSSHAYYGINCSLLGGNYYNLSSTSQSLYEDFIILKFFKYKNIKNVILPISYFSNHLDLVNTSIEGESIRMFDYEHAYNARYPHNWKYYRNELNLTTQVAKYILIDVFGNFDYDFDKYGCKTDACTYMKFDISDSISSFTRHNLNHNFKRRNPYLDSIISYCAESEINLNIVVFPFTKGYQNAISNDNNDFEKFLITLKEQASPKLKFIDCRNIISKDEEIYFRDSDHLSPCGRDSLSRYLRNLIVR
jgi:hypothetical protein